ncbi:MAG TPA: ABC transporter substrate-binding protein [Nevskiaceae bacterium]
MMSDRTPRLRAIAVICVAAALPWLAARAAGDSGNGVIKVGFINAMSGPNAALGLPQDRGLKVAHSLWPVINGHEVEVITLDDASDPAASERDARKLVNQDKVDILIGTVGVPNVMALAALASETHTPHISPDPPAHAETDSATQWSVTIEQPFSLMVGAVARQMKKDGVKTVAYIGFSDALGDLAHRDLVESGKQLGFKVLDDERYARSDTSVDGQVLRMMALHPDAVFGGNSGSAGALPFLALKKFGYKGRVYDEHGVINDAFVKVVGAAGNGLVAPTGPSVVAEQLPKDDPIRPVALKFLTAYRDMFHAEPTGLFESYGYDAYRLFAKAAETVSVPPGTAAYREALRGAILSTHGLVQTNGILSFKPGDFYGYSGAGADQHAVVVVRLQGGKWQLVQ